MIGNQAVEHGQNGRPAIALRAARFISTSAASDQVAARLLLRPHLVGDIVAIHLRDTSRDDRLQQRFSEIVGGFPAAAVLDEREVTPSRIRCAARAGLLCRRIASISGNYSI